MPRRRLAALAVVAVIASCAAPSDSATPSPSGPAGTSVPASAGAGDGSVLVVRLPDAEPADLESAAIDAAFDPETAAGLASALPGDLDWSTSGVICVYLGRRADGGWGLAIQSASLVDGELRVLARETRPVAGVDQPGPSFAADCATIDRATLPVGGLSARADDTVTDEFIVDGQLEVPAP